MKYRDLNGLIVITLSRRNFERLAYQWTAGETNPQIMKVIEGVGRVIVTVEKNETHYNEDGTTT